MYRMAYTKHLTQHNNRSKIVFKGKKGTASFPVKQFFRAPVAQEKLYKEEGCWVEKNKWISFTSYWSCIC